MTKAEAAAAIRAAAWSATASIGWREAIQLLQEVAHEIETEQWKNTR